MQGSGNLSLFIEAYWEFWVQFLKILVCLLNILGAIWEKFLTKIGSLQNFGGILGAFLTIPDSDFLLDKASLLHILECWPSCEKISQILKMTIAKIMDLNLEGPLCLQFPGTP